MNFISELSFREFKSLEVSFKIKFVFLLLSSFLLSITLDQWINFRFQGLLVQNILNMTINKFKFKSKTLQPWINSKSKISEDTVWEVKNGS